MVKHREYSINFILLAVALVFISSCANFSSEVEFFNGKTVTIIVPHGTGGGMDAYARLIAPFLQEYLPGSKVEVRNVPDSGGLAGKNQVFAANPDGLTLLFASGAGTLLAEWAGQPGVEYRTAEYSWIGRINAEPHILAVSPSTGYENFGDITKAGKVSMSFAGVSTDDYYVALITSQILGYKVQAHTQYLGTNDATLACAKGEVEAIMLSASSILPQIAAQTLVPIVSFSSQRSDDQPDLPTILEVVPPEKQKVMQALVYIFQLDRNFLAPPNLSPARLKTLRDALDKAMADPKLRESMLKMRRPVHYLTGRETEELLAKIQASKAEIQPILRQIVLDSK